MVEIWTRLDGLPPVANTPYAKAAVLVPLYRDDEQRVRVVLTVRPDSMPTHPGDVVFPGGRIAPGEDPITTALRETHEEVGIPAGSVEIVGGLTPVTTRDPRNLIVPVVARVDRPESLVPDPREVAAIIEPPMAALLDDDGWRTADWMGQTMWFYEFPEGMLWGATAFMMRELVRWLRTV